MVGLGEGPLEIQVAKDDVLVVCMGVFNAQSQVCGESCARAAHSKSFLFGAEDFSTFDIVSGQHGYACGPEFV